MTDTSLNHDQRTPRIPFVKAVGVPIDAPIGDLPEATGCEEQKVMHLFLHAGTEKTGTTAIQDFLRLNRKRLREHSVFIPESLVHGATGNHRRLVALVADEDAPDDFYSELDIVSLSKRREMISTWRSSFEDELAEAATCDVAIITSEHLHSRLRRQSEVERLRDLLASKFGSISVIMYLRDPLDTILASVSTVVKAGGALMEIPGPKHPGWRFLVDHMNTLQFWGRIFGPESVIPRLFIPDELKAGNVIADFAEVCNLDIEGLDVPAKKNESLSMIGMQILAQINQDIPRILPEGGLNPARGRLTEVFSQCFTSGPRLRAGGELATAYKNEFRDSNEWVRRNFFPEREILFPCKQHVTDAASNMLAEDLRDISALVERLWENRKEPLR